MSVYSLSHLGDQDLLRGLASLVAHDRKTTAMLLAHVAEIDARRLYVPAGFPSMFLYCVHELRLSEDSASKRIQAARTARLFPAIFNVLAEGRLNLRAVNLLAPYLTPGNAAALLEAAAHKTTREIEQLLAERFPRSETLALVQAIPSSPLSPTDQRPAVPAESCASDGLGAVGAHAARHVPAAPRSNSTPIAPERFLFRFTLEQSAHDDLQYAQAMLSHQIPSGDVAKVIALALRTLVCHLEKRKFAATRKPSQRPRRTTGKRHIPAHVKRAVWERDGGQCTFVSPAGRRCPARKLLEFDHIQPVALGGQATVDNTRLLCSSHNQFAAESALGSEFMRRKREEAQRIRAGAREQAASREAAKAHEQAAAAERARELDVVPWLRELGFRPDRPAAPPSIATAPFPMLRSRSDCAPRCVS